MSDAMTDATYHQERTKYFDIITDLCRHHKYELALSLARHIRDHTLGKYVPQCDAVIRRIEGLISKRRKQL